MRWPRAGAVGRTLVPDDLYRVQDVTDPQVSPDGAWVAYVLGTNDRGADEARSAIWMVSWDGSQHLALTAPADGIGKPRWSPDGRFLAYVATPGDSDKSQVMLLDRRGGQARPLAQLEGEVGEYAWSPDGKRLVLVLAHAEEGASPRPIVIDALHFKQDGDGYLAANRARHLVLYEVDSGLQTALTSDPGFNEDLPSWSPDGTRIAFTRTRERGPDADGREDIDVIEPRAGATARTLARPFAPNAQRLAWSADGAWVAFLQGIEPKYNAYMQDRLFVVSSAGGVPRALTDSLDRAVTSFAIDGASGSALIAVEDDRTIYPARVDLASGSIVRATAASKSAVSSLNSAAGHTALIQTSDAALGEVFALEGGQLRKLTSHNDDFLAEIQWAPVEDVQFKSKGVDIHGLLVTPPGYVAGRKYPLVLWIHGGPNGQDEHSLELDGYQFEPQMFAAKGYVVLRVNYRGGSGRGGQFAREIFADWGHKEVQDLIAGVDYLIGRGIADPSRLAVGGWSYAVAS